jgi:ribonuclease HII
MRAALARLHLPPGLVLVDGNLRIPGITYTQRAIVAGDRRSASVAAASILAKVARDAFMAHADRRYPAYGFRQHKGYATAAHLDALERLGPCPLHRRSFHGVVPGGVREPVDPSLELPLF